MRKNLLVSEVMTRVHNADSVEEKSKILKDYETHALLYVLRNGFTPQITFEEIGVPEYNKSRNAIGLDPSSLHQEARRIYVLADDYTKVATSRKREILLQILESIHSSEAKLLEQVLRKDIKVKGLTPELVEKTFPGLLSWRGKAVEPKKDVSEEVTDPLDLGVNETKPKKEPKPKKG